VKTVSTLEFKRRAYEFLEEIQTTGKPILVTKNGRPHAMAMPIEKPKPNSKRKTLKASVPAGDKAQKKGETRVKRIDARK
jgi:prevent-host-death family protein